MKLINYITQGLSALFAAAPALAASDTWDGGGADNFVTTGLNWADNTAPVSDLANTDLFFAGTTRLPPNFPSPFHARTVAFTNTSGPFNLTGLPLTIGTIGVADGDPDTQTFSMLVIVGVPETTITATAGGLGFQGGILPSDRIIESTGAGSMSMANLNGSGTFNKAGLGTVTIQASNTPISADLNLFFGTMQIGATGITQTFASSSTVTMAGGNLAFLENTIFDAGAQLIRTSGTPSVAAEKTLTFQGGSDFNITGDYTFPQDCDIVVTGAGSQVVTTNGSLVINSQTLLSVQNNPNRGHPPIGRRRGLGPGVRPGPAIPAAIKTRDGMVGCPGVRPVPTWSAQRSRKPRRSAAEGWGSGMSDVCDAGCSRSEPHLGGSPHFPPPPPFSLMLSSAMRLTLELPPRGEQLAFNRRRWEEVRRDSFLRDTLHRIETNAHGNILMSPPPAGNHSDRTLRIQLKLVELLGGRPLPECPVSTIGGVRAPDVGWYSDARYATVVGQAAFETAPEICVEVLSPDNTPAEMCEKRQLYFDAGAREFWTCDMENRMTFHHADHPEHEQPASALCPDFPSKI